PERLFQDLVFGAQVVDDLLLPPVHPAREDDQQKLPRLQNEVHARSDDVGRKATASVIDQPPSTAKSPVGRAAQVPSSHRVALRLTFFTIRAASAEISSSYLQQTSRDVGFQPSFKFLDHTRRVVRASI